MSDEYLDDDWPEGGDEVTDVVECPNCGADVYELADSCPACGEFIVADTRPLSGKPGWYLALGILGIIAAVVVLSGLVQFF